MSTAETPEVQTPEPAPPAARKHGPLAFLKELPVLIVIAFALAILLKTFVVQAFYIPSPSMVPTLQVGDRVLVNKLVYKVRDPQRGDIIVFADPQEEAVQESFLRRVRNVFTEGFGGQTDPRKDFIKRVIGLPGETVELEGGKVFITPPGGGTRFVLSEPYISPELDDAPFETTVPADEYFVLGDNRPNSSDSRFVGTIPRSEIIGKAFLRVWPPRRFDFFTRPIYLTPA